MSELSCTMQTCFLFYSPCKKHHVDTNDRSRQRYRCEAKCTFENIAPDPLSYIGSSVSLTNTTSAGFKKGQCDSLGALMLNTLRSLLLEEVEEAAVLCSISG